MKSTSAKKTKKKAKSVDEFMGELDHPFRDEVQAVREIIKGVNRNITEEVKWAAPSYLKVLEHAGLIARSRDAQWRPCRLDAGPLKEVADWVERYRRFWEQSFERLDDYLRELKMKEKKHGRKQGKH